MAREVNYSKENYLILARRNKQLQKEFPQIWENIQAVPTAPMDARLSSMPEAGGFLAG